jgi:antitoxin MazE
MQVAQWGNSLAVRLPVALVQDLGLKLGSEIEFKASAQTKSQRNAAALQIQVVRRPSKLERLQALHHLRSPMPEGYRFDRDEANSR